MMKSTNFKKSALAALGAVGLAAGAVIGTSPSQAADHLDAPRVAQDGRVDINDLYVFESPENPDNTVMIMTVNPGAGVLSPTVFHDRARYDFSVDNDGDARPDRNFYVTFSQPLADGSQRVLLNGALRGKGVTGESIEGNTGKAFAGTFEDPFFFDLQAFQDQVKGGDGGRTFCDGNETDFFAGLDVSAIAIEVPTDYLTDGNGSDISVYSTTKLSGNVIDRMGRPAIATVLVNDGREDRYNRTAPAQHQNIFGDEIAGNLLALSGLDGTPYTADQAEALTGILLPDVLTYDTSAPASYLNGRALSDDVIDTSLVVATGGLFGGSAVLDSDCVDGNDASFSNNFPYLASANG